MPVVVQPQGLSQIAGGTNTVWNNAPAAARTAALLADIAAMRTGDPQDGYGALPPAIPASGAHYSAPGAYEGYADYGFPPVMYQRSPYATAAYRTYMSPFGQLGVQPLIGFPSAYPHVIQYPGDNPFRVQGLLDAMVGSMWPHWPVPAMPMMRGRMGAGGGGGASRGGTTQSQNPTTNAAAQTPPAPMKLVPPEVRYAGNGYVRPDAAPQVQMHASQPTPSAPELWPDYEGDMWSDLEAPVYPVTGMPSGVRAWELMSPEGTNAVPTLPPQRSIPNPSMPTALQPSHETVSLPQLAASHGTLLDLVDPVQAVVQQSIR